LTDSENYSTSDKNRSTPDRELPVH